MKSHHGKKASSSFFFLLICFLFVGCNSSSSGTAGHAGPSSYLHPDREDIPALQVFAPGFFVQELPVILKNINVLRYGPDGRLYALAYDGRIYVLTDSDGDGLEDKAEFWWDKDPLISPVGMVVAKEGIYVTSKNKVSLIKDTDNDGKAETEDIITSDWAKPSRYTGTSSGGVDAMGIAKDESGAIFFALGTANFINAYLVDSLDQANYDLNSERGTILKVSPGSHKREIVATGTRFPVAMAFNKEGDLFATDQEGATWLPNGNPYDELLHIRKGRHYGFPPRHPERLPDVIDEPSVYNYKPQHQSTTGLNFNQPINDGVVFGPAWWAGDAIVTGYSRGKIYRTKLVKTPSGYVARNNILASLTALTVDACVSPDGDLVVATHSGFPDWGYGPQAEGKLYKIMYTNPDLPQPVSVWAAEDDQVNIAFDKPVEKEYLANLADNIYIEYGQYVRAGDQFETIRPGYRAVERQMRFPRKELNVKHVELSDDRRTLTVHTFTHTSPVTYAITLPAFSNDKSKEERIRQIPAMDLSYELNGVEVRWQARSGGDKWKGVVPHLDLEVSRSLMEPVAEHKALEKVLKKPGRVTVKTKLNLWHMLRPNTQPESTLDYEYAPEDVSLTFKSSRPLEIKAPLASHSESAKKGQFYETKIIFKAVEKQPYSLEVAMDTGPEKPEFEVYYSTKEDPRPRALPIHRFFLPWVEEIFPKEMSLDIEKPELAGGNWSRGKELFFGEATCATCHSIDGKGGTIGPDLSNLAYRDYNSVLKDIKNPSAAINPDYLAHKVTLKSGHTLTGMISYKADSMIVRDIADKKTTVSRMDVKSTVPMSVSLMPPGLDKVLGKQKLKDLMTYLLTSFKPAQYKRNFGVPQIRSASEVDAILGKNSTESTRNKSEELLKILWVSGPKDHGRDEHDYPLQQKRWTELISLADNVEINSVSQWPSSAQFKNADVIVFYWNYPQFTEENGKQLDRFLQRGGGLVYLHYAVDATANPQALANRIGMVWKRGYSKFRHGRVQLNFSEGKHPITQGFKNVAFKDESYWRLVKGTKKVNVLATANEKGRSRPMLWTTAEGNGRVFVSLLGHYNWTFDDPLFRILLLRGMAWAGHQPTDRWEELATMGARMTKY